MLGSEIRRQFQYDAVRLDFDGLVAARDVDEHIPAQAHGFHRRIRVARQARQRLGKVRGQLRDRAHWNFDYGLVAVLFALKDEGFRLSGRRDA